MRLSGSRKGLLSIVAGTAGGQVVTLLAAPLLSRMYTPADFGVFTVASTLAVVLGTVAALRFELAIPLPERERDAHSLVILGLVAAGATAVVGTVVVAIGGRPLTAAFRQPHLMPWLWFVPTTAATMSAVLVLTQLAVRHRRYGGIGRRNLGQSIAMGMTQTVAGAGGLRPGGMVIGYGVGQAIAALSLIPGSGFHSADAREGRRWAYLRSTAARYRRFPLLLAPSGLFNILGAQLPVLLIAYRYGPEVAGWLGLTQRVLALPVALVGVAVAQVYLAELSRSARSSPGQARTLFRRASRHLTLLAGLGGLVIFAAGPAAFSLTFGANWANSGVYARALALSVATQFIAAPLSQTLIVLERQGLQFAWDLGRTVLVTVAVGITAFTGHSPVTAMWVFGTTSAIAYATAWCMSAQAISTACRPTTEHRVSNPEGAKDEDLIVVGRAERDALHQRDDR